MSASDKMHTGGCLCGAIRYQVSGPPLRAMICHCGQCRRQSGSALPTVIAWPRDKFAITKGEPAGIRLSTFATRQFCRDCGTPLFWNRDNGTHMTVFLGSLDDAEAMPKPVEQYWTGRRIPWVPEMPEIKGFAGDHEG